MAVTFISPRGVGRSVLLDCGGIGGHKAAVSIIGEYTLAGGVDLYACDFSWKLMAPYVSDEVMR